MIETSYLAHLPAPSDRQHWLLYGTRGGAEFSSDKGLAAGSCAFPGNAWHDLTPEIDGAAVRAAAPTSLLHDFIAAIRENRDPFVTGEQAAIVTRLIEAGYRSADSGREVVL